MNKLIDSEPSLLALLSAINLTIAIIAFLIIRFFLVTTMRRFCDDKDRYLPREWD